MSKGSKKRGFDNGEFLVQWTCNCLSDDLQAEPRDQRYADVLTELLSAVVRSAIASVVFALGRGSYYV